MRNEMLCLIYSYGEAGWRRDAWVLQRNIGHVPAQELRSSSALFNVETAVIPMLGAPRPLPQ